jgi:hypothetical protein
MVTSTTESSVRRATTQAEWAHWAPWTGIAFVVLFVTGVFTTNSTNDNASNREWLNYYAQSGNQIRILVSGFLFVLAALCLATFITTLWSRIAEARRPEATSPLPLVGAGMGAVGVALGGVLAAVVPGAMIFGQLRLPSADILRYSSDASFPTIAVLGMFGVALAIAGVGVLASSAGLFGRRFAVVSLVVALITLFSFGFFPLIVPLLWFLIVSIMLLRKNAASGTKAASVP